MQIDDVAFCFTTALIIFGATLAFMNTKGGFSPNEVGAFLGVSLFAIAFVVLVHLLEGEYREATTVGWIGVEVGFIASFCFLAAAKEHDDNLDMPALLPAICCLTAALLFFMFASWNNRAVYPVERRFAASSA